MMAELPVSPGAAQETVRVVPPEVTDSMTGTPGRVPCPMILMFHDFRVPALPLIQSFIRSVHVPAAASPRCRADPNRKLPSHSKSLY